MSPTFAFNRAPVAFLPVALLALACTRTNPDYCDGVKAVCSGGRVCDRDTNSCVLPDAAAELDAPVADARIVDARDTCATDDDCKTSAQGPTCVRGLCKKCGGANDCRTGLYCAADAGTCVQCTDTDGCLDTPASPVCVQNRCAPCTERKEACATRYPDTPACAPDGTCVQCAADSDCHDKGKPICGSDHKCAPCTSDSQCAARMDNAGVCLLQEGRCAPNDEVIHVQNGPGCSMTPGAGGTATTPFCFSQQGLDAVTPTRRVVVLHGPEALTNWTAAPVGEPVNVIGQGKALIAPGAFAGIRITGGEIYLRGVTVSGGTQAGIVVENGAVLHMNRCIVTKNRGGLLVVNAGFDIANTVIADNKGAIVPNTATSYGGVYLKSVPGKPALFRNDTIVANEVIGLVCEGPSTTKSLLVTGNAVEQVVGCGDLAHSIVGGASDFDPVTYHLTSTSRCVDKGDPSDFPKDDLDGDPRPLGAGSDCGADEFNP